MLLSPPFYVKLQAIFESPLKAQSYVLKKGNTCLERAVVKTGEQGKVYGNSRPLPKAQGGKKNELTAALPKKGRK